MRLLIDEPLSEKLTELLQDLFPESLHVRSLGAGGAPDPMIWDLAIKHDCLLLTKDEDFHRLSILYGAPPKVIWVRMGNCTTDDIEDLIRRHQQSIERFAAQDEATVLVLR